MANKQHKNDQQGFTLLEAVVVIIVIAILAVGATNVLQGTTTFFTNQNINTAVWQGRLALERMSRDIILVRSATAADITSATASQFTFNDVNGNNVSYTLSGTTLNRNSQPLANGINSVTFSYLDSTETAMSFPVTVANISYVTISLNITQGGTNYTMITTICPRNLLP